MSPMYLEICTGRVWRRQTFWSCIDFDKTLVVCLRWWRSVVIKQRGAKMHKWERVGIATMIEGRFRCCQGVETWCKCRQNPHLCNDLLHDPYPGASATSRVETPQCKNGVQMCRRVCECRVLPCNQNLNVSLLSCTLQPAHDMHEQSDSAIKCAMTFARWKITGVGCVMLSPPEASHLKP